MDAVQALIARLSEIEPYPECMPGITPRLTGRAFFPGGLGRSEKAPPPLPPRPLMILGQDFGTLDYWNSAGSGDEPADGTWGALIRMLDAAHIPPAQCFFTNAIMGVRREKPISGPHPALDDHAFIARCADFLMTQIELMRPSVVVALGIFPTVLAARRLSLTTLRMPTWTGSQRNPQWKDIDAAGLQKIDGIVISPDTRLTFSFASVLHPANRTPNLRLRIWSARSLKAAAAEEAIWNEIAASHRSANS